MTVKYIQDVLNLINDVDLKTLVEVSTSRNMFAFIKQPASCGKHHSYEGGLLVHSHSTAILAGQMAQHFIDRGQEINRDLCIAGAFLHDIGKVLCYSEISDSSDPAAGLPGEYVPTEESILFHHIPIGFHMVASIAESFRIDKKKYYPLLHIILSHHGRLEYHSPVVPKTAEAFIVHQADLSDAYIDSTPEMRKFYNS